MFGPWRRAPAAAPPVVRFHGWRPAALAFGHDPLALLRAARARHGDVFTLDLGLLRMSFVLGPAHQSAFFRADADVLDFHAAAAQVMAAILGPDTYGSDRLAASTTSLIRRGLLAPGALLKYEAAIDAEVDATLDAWLAAGEIDVFPAVSRLVNDIAVRCFMGEEVRRRHGEAVARAYYAVEKHGSALLSVAFPRLPLPSVRRAAAARADILACLTEVVRERRAPDATPHDDYVQPWIDHRLADGTQFSAAEIQAHLLGILFAAHTNTTGMIAWTMCELLQRPALMSDVVDESLRTTTPDPRALALLARCLRETARLHFTPLLARKATRPYAAGATTIPAGHLVCISPILVHTDPQHYPDPARYDPERWSDPAAHKARVLAGTYVQFGLGAHRCPGENFATLAFLRCWHRLLRRAELQLRTHPLPPPDWSSGGTPFPTGPVRVRVQPRQRLS
jgi:sterol 14-demethylase